ncbi:Uma2 family endonuclease [Rhodopila sp.]|uniref:Uma2 family endonuclease n=1 Tax=Rhodopila sp. TaxID=2480087 RepID=UPI003D0EAFD1
MSSAERQRRTVEAFLAWEEQQPTRYEFDGVQPVAMTGGTADHSRVQLNLLSALKAGLRGSSCEPFGSELKILAAGTVRYPDAFVVCSPVLGKATYVTNPVVVFEMISPSTSGTDRIIKNQEYRDTSSIQRYVILEQDRQAAMVFARDHDDWTGHLIAGDAELHMPEINISLPLPELYVGVELTVDPPADISGGFG